ncbi:hypothetical protein BDK51DRAFT_50008, partial [Blyttiomyces helicus]
MPLLAANSSTVPLVPWAEHLEPDDECGWASSTFARSLFTDNEDAPPSPPAPLSAVPQRPRASVSLCLPPALPPPLSPLPAPPANQNPVKEAQQQVIPRPLHPASVYGTPEPLVFAETPIPGELAPRLPVRLSRKGFVRVLNDPHMCHEFSIFCQDDSRSLTALCFLKASDYFESLLSAAIPAHLVNRPRGRTYAHQRFLLSSPEVPPEALQRASPTYDVPASLLSHLGIVYELYLTPGKPPLPNVTSAMRWRADVLARARPVKCGVLDELVGAVIEALYKGAYRRFVAIRGAGTGGGETDTLERGRERASLDERRPPSVVLSQTPRSRS